MADTGEMKSVQSRGPSVGTVENSVRTEPNTEMRRFETALREIMRVSKEDLIKLQEASKSDKPRRGPKPKRTAGDLL